jgi:asparagine synthase (glutamine-hydrolysing)
MCGICGAVRLQPDGEPVEHLVDLPAMVDAMVHRGPDDRGTYVLDDAALGARRLSIIDVEHGHQPFSNERGDVWAVLNGELYNHPALRDGLLGRGHELRSRCDTEVLPHLYEEQGEALPTQITGDFAIAVWDERRRQLLLARDRLGVKPLYVAQRGDLLLFASELKSLLAGGAVEPALDYDAVEAYLTLGYVPGPHTLLEGVSKLLPGERLVAGNGTVRVDRYRRYPEPGAPVRPAESLDEAADGLVERLEQAVEARLLSDVPLGVMLSGGVDSSLLVALMTRVSSRPVKTFSIGLGDPGGRSELDDARLVARTFGTEHHELHASVADRDVSLEDAVWFLDEPVADVSTLGFFTLSSLTRRHVTVALSGQGADELLGGYLKHEAAYVADLYARLPRPVGALGKLVARRAPTHRFGRARATLLAPDAGRRLIAMSGQLGDGARTRLLRGPLAGSRGAALAAVAPYARTGGALPVTLFMDAQLALPHALLHYFDRMSMAHSLEVRVPYLDERVVEYCATLPSSAKIRGLERKRVLRHAAARILPRRILEKPKVGFFRHAAGSWLESRAAEEVRRYLLDGELRCGEFLDRDAVRGLAARGARRSATEDRLLLSILMLEVWLSSYLPRAASKPERARL